MSSARIFKLVLTVFFLLTIIGVTAFFVHEYMAGHFKSQESLRIYISSYGIYGFVALTIL